MSDNAKPLGKPQTSSNSEQKAASIDNTYEPSVKSNVTESLTMKSDKTDVNRDEINDIIKAIQTPNPPSEYFMRSGGGAHIIAEELAAERRRFFEEQRSFEKDRITNDSEEFHELHPDDRSYYANNGQPERDPLMVNKNNISDENSSYFKRWQQNIEEQKQNAEEHKQNIEERKD